MLLTNLMDCLGKPPSKTPSKNGFVVVTWVPLCFALFGAFDMRLLIKILLPFFLDKTNESQPGSSFYETPQFRHRLGKSACLVYGPLANVFLVFQRGN